ncbi:chromate transporter [bacterium]|nr:chromate transporter [bacterium]
MSKNQVDGNNKIGKMRHKNIKTNAGKPILKKAINFFLYFFKLGFMTYGGPAMLGFIKKEVVYKHQLISEEEYNDGIALVNVIPGATNSQMVAYIGYKLKKGNGAFLAFSAFVIPAFIEMLIFTIIYKTTGNIGLFMQIFKTLEAVIVAILLNTTIMLGSRVVKEWRLDVLALITLSMLILKLNVLFILLITVVLTFLLFMIGKEFWPFPENMKNIGFRKKTGMETGDEKFGKCFKSNPSREVKDRSSKSINIENFERREPNDIRGSKSDNLKNSKINLNNFFRTYWPFFMALALVITALTLSYFLKRNLFLAGLSLTKASVLGFGGAIPMLTIIQYDMVNVLKIFGQKQIVDALVLGQITPGPIMITSTFIGYYIFGFTGAILCTVVAFYPSFAIFSLVAPKYETVKNNKYVKLAIRGIMGMFVGMLLFFLYSVGREAIKGYASGAVALLSFIAVRFKVKEIYIIAGAAIISAILYFSHIIIT